MVILSASQEFSIRPSRLLSMFLLALKIEVDIATDTVDLKRAKKVCIVYQNHH